MNKSLYHISTEAMDIVSALEETEGELNPTIESLLKINQSELQEKSFNYAYVVKSIDNDITAINEEIKRLQALKKRNESIVSRMKEAVIDAMHIYGLEKITSPTLNLSIRRSEAVEVDENFHEDIYMVKKVTYTPDKTRLKEAIKRGQNIEGARIIENYNLQIK
jgi:hypothetical protein